MRKYYADLKFVTYGTVTPDMRNKTFSLYNALTAATVGTNKIFSLELYKKTLEGARIVFTASQYLQKLTK